MKEFITSYEFLGKEIVTDQNLNNELRQGYFRMYAYENKFEFLSVLLVYFFETPPVFKTTHPELYAHIAKMINFKEEYLN